MKNALKRFLKELAPAAIILAVFSYMLTLVEPLVFYSSNVNDIWFRFKDIIGLLLLFFIVATIASIFIFALLLLVSKKVFKKTTPFHICTLILLVCFIATYIQGNYLAGSLPTLDGNVIDWDRFAGDNVVSIILWIVVIAATIILAKKITVKKVIKYGTYVTAAIAAMLTVSIIAVVPGSGLMSSDGNYVATYDNFNETSSNQNFYMFLVDATDSQAFQKAVTDTDAHSKLYAETFKDFSYFPDAMSKYSFTRDSIPQILTQTENHNEQPFTKYTAEAYAQSPIINSFYDDSYKIGLYDDEILAPPVTAQKVPNMRNDTSVRLSQFALQTSIYVMFKYLPYPLKKLSDIDNFTLNSMASDTDNFKKFTWVNGKNYELINNTELTKTDQKVFQFIHLEGAHVPYNCTEDVEYLPDYKGTENEKLVATLNIIKSFINRLKKADAYDNSTIIILADHGVNDDRSKRFNPIFYVKGVNEKHDEMLVSDKPIIYSDFTEAFKELREGKASNEIFSDISFPRERITIDNPFKYENKMDEYKATGHAWESDKINKTGVVYELK